MLTLKGGVKSMGKSMSSILKKIRQITIKMGNQAMQESPICGLFEPKIPEKLKK